MNPFGQSTRSPVNGESAGLVTSDTERSRTGPKALSSGVFGQREDQIRRLSSRKETRRPVFNMLFTLSLSIIILQ